MSADFDECAISALKSARVAGRPRRGGWTVPFPDVVDNFLRANLPSAGAVRSVTSETVYELGASGPSTRHLGAPLINEWLRIFDLRYVFIARGCRAYGQRYADARQRAK